MISTETMAEVETISETEEESQDLTWGKCPVKSSKGDKYIFEWYRINQKILAKLYIRLNICNG